MSLTLKSEQVWVDVDIAPGVAGPQRHPLHRAARSAAGPDRRGHDGAAHPPGRGPAAVHRAAAEARRRATTSRRCTTSRTPAKWQMTIRVQSRRDRRGGAHGQVHCADVPDVDVTTNFFLVLTLVADAVVVVALAARARRAGVAPGAGRGGVAVAGVRSAPQAVLLAWIVATSPRSAASTTREHAGLRAVRAVLVPAHRDVPARRRARRRRGCGATGRSGSPRCRSW